MPVGGTSTAYCGRFATTGRTTAARVRPYRRQPRCNALYDNDHVYKREGHADAFHKHVFNDRTWTEVTVEHIGREQFPTLLEVIDELYDWWVQHRDDPLIYP